MKIFGILFFTVITAWAFWACKVRVGESTVKAGAPNSDGIWRCSSLGVTSPDYIENILNKTNCSSSPVYIKDALCCLVGSK